jgi:hypothetical protein
VKLILIDAAREEKVQRKWNWHMKGSFSSGFKPDGYVCKRKPPRLFCYNYRVCAPSRPL